MVYLAIYNKAIFRIEASSERMAKRLLKKHYGFCCEVVLLNLFKYSERHLHYAKQHERSIYGRAKGIFNQA